MITFTDLIFILIIFGFAFAGFWFGFIHMVGSFISIVAAAIISGKYFDIVADRLGFLFGGYGNLGRVGAFVLLFLLVTRMVCLVFYLINKLFHLLTVIPFLKTINRIGGAILGLFEGLVLSSLTVYLLVRFPLSNAITGALANSQVVDFLLNLANRFAPLLPDVVQKAQGIVS